MPVYWPTNCTVSSKIQDACTIRDIYSNADDCVMSVKCCYIKVVLYTIYMLHDDVNNCRRYKATESQALYFRAKHIILLKVIHRLCLCFP